MRDKDDVTEIIAKIIREAEKEAEKEKIMKYKSVEIRRKILESVTEDLRNIEKILSVCDTSSLEVLEKELDGLKYIKRKHLALGILAITCKLDTVMLIKHNENGIYIDSMQGQIDCGMNTVYITYDRDKTMKLQQLVEV